MLSEWWLLIGRGVIVCRPGWKQLACGRTQNSRRRASMRARACREIRFPILGREINVPVLRWLRCRSHMHGTPIRTIETLPDTRSSYHRHQFCVGIGTTVRHHRRRFACTVQGARRSARHWRVQRQYNYGCSTTVSGAFVSHSTTIIVAATRVSTTRLPVDCSPRSLTQHNTLFTVT